MKKLLLASSILLSFGALAEDKKPFTMDGEFGMIYTTGNTETTSITGKLAAHQELTRWSNDYKAEALYKKDKVIGANGAEENKKTAQKFFLSGQWNYKLDNPNYRIFGFASYEDDEFSGYDYQGTLAAGWSQKVWDNETSKFEYSIGPGYSFAETKAGQEVNGFIVRAALDYQYNISETAKFRQLLSTEIGSDNTKTKSESSVTSKLGDALSMKFSFIVNNNSDVPPGVEKTDTQTAVTLVYTFF